jgi:hypothetical protein
VKLDKGGSYSSLEPMLRAVHVRELVNITEAGQLRDTPEHVTFAAVTLDVERRAALVRSLDETSRARAIADLALVHFTATHAFRKSTRHALQTGHLDADE